MAERWVRSGPRASKLFLSFQSFHMKSTLRRGVPERPQRSATGRLYIVIIVRIFMIYTGKKPQKKSLKRHGIMDDTSDTNEKTCENKQAKKNCETLVCQKLKNWQDREVFFFLKLILKANFVYIWTTPVIFAGNNSRHRR